MCAAVLRQVVAEYGKEVAADERAEEMGGTQEVRLGIEEKEGEKNSEID